MSGLTPGLILSGGADGFIPFEPAALAEFQGEQAGLLVFDLVRRAVWDFAVRRGSGEYRPLLVEYRGGRMPFLKFYSEADYGGDFKTEANYKAPEVQCLIATGGVVDCFDTPEDILAAICGGVLSGRRF